MPVTHPVDHALTESRTQALKLILEKEPKPYWWDYVANLFRRAAKIRGSEMES